MPGHSFALRPLAGALLLGLLLPLVGAHGDDDGMKMDMSMSTPARPVVNETVYDPNYFFHPEHRGLMYGHIALMTLAWVFVLPVGEFPQLPE
jgi:hypothetical protein